MADANGGRQLPWHDTARCEMTDCGGSMVPTQAMCNGFSGPANSRIACVACGHGRIGSPEDVAKTEKAHRAWEQHEAGLVHPDRGCAGCNAALPLERTRLCVACVEKDNQKRQGSLF